MNLRPYQEEGVRWLVGGRVRGLAFDAGLGKTITAVMAAQQVRKPVTVVCPAALVRWWERHFDAGALRTGYVEVCSYGKFASSRNMIGRVLIVDESHYVKNPLARRTKNVIEAAKLASHTWFLSATPATNSPLDYYVPLSLVAKLPPQFVWIRQYCDVTIDPLFGSIKVWRYKPGAKEQLREMLKKVWLFRRWSDVADQVPEITWEEFPLDDAEAKRQMDRIAHEVPELQQSVEWMMEHQTNLTRIRHLLGITKAAAVADFIRQKLERGWRDERLVVYCEFHDSLNLIHSQLAPVAPLVVQYTGDMSPTKREAALDIWKRTPGSVLLVQIRAGGVGLNLPEARIAVIAEGTWSPADWYQAASRLRRMDKPHPVLVVCPFIENTVDEAVVRTVARKAALCNIQLGGK